MRRLSAAGVRRFACVACRGTLPVFDEFPLVDGTFFLSPRHYGIRSRESFLGFLSFFLNVL